jgi:hypothetical protein
MMFEDTEQLLEKHLTRTRNGDMILFAANCHLAEEE